MTATQLVPPTHHHKLVVPKQWETKMTSLCNQMDIAQSATKEEAWTAWKLYFFLFDCYGIMQ